MTSLSIVPLAGQECFAPRHCPHQIGSPHRHRFVAPGTTRGVDAGIKRQRFCQRLHSAPHRVEAPLISVQTRHNRPSFGRSGYQLVFTGMDVGTTTNRPESDHVYISHDRARTGKYWPLSVPFSPFLVLMRPSRSGGGTLGRKRCPYRILIMASSQDRRG